MLKSAILTFFFTATIYTSCAQVTNNSVGLDLNIEKDTGTSELSSSWRRLIDKNSYLVTKDSLEAHSGKYSVSIESLSEEGRGGVAVLSFPADYEGETIELRGYLKLKDVSKGFAGLFLRIDGDGEVLAVNTMQNKKLKGNKKWASYSVKLHLPENADSIRVGAGLWGLGQIWADDFQILIDGKDISKAKRKEKAPAELDTAFNQGSPIQIENVDPDLITNLAVLGKVWGFLKYYHPAVATGNYNWDYELFRIMPEILSAGNPNERNTVLLNWTKKFGDIEASGFVLPEKDKIKLLPDLEWINEGNLGIELTNLLLRVRDAKRDKDHKNHYVSTVSSVPVPQFKNEPAYSQFTLPDAGFRLLSLYRYWNIIQYYFPYKNLIDDDWNKVLEEYIPKFISASSELDYKKTALSLIANIHDSHANLIDANLALRREIGLKYPAIEVKFIENKAVVTDYFDEELGELTGLKKGDVIESINGTHVDSIIQRRLPYVSASNYPTKLRNLSVDLLNTNDSIMVIGFMRNDSVGQANLRTYGQKDINRYESSRYQDTCLKRLDGNTAYFHPGSVRVDYLPNVMKEVFKTENLIIDLRTYPNESIIKQMGDYLFEKPVEFSKFTFFNADQPGLFTFGEPAKIGKENPSFYKGRIIMLVNEMTQSNAEFTAMGFRAARNTMIIGSKTAGADGNVIPRFNLPGGLSTVFTGLGVYYPDGKETQRIGIVPDLEVTPTIKGIREERDEVLEKALELIRE